MYRDFLQGDDIAFAETSTKCDWMMVYIQEAHAQDEWPISSGRYVPNGKPVIVNQPKSSTERINVCRDFMETYDIEENKKLMHHGH
jgi:hypothetical protein